MNFILASGSPRRKQILHELGIAFSVCPATVAEVTVDRCPERIPVLNAVAKAEAVAVDHPDAVVMGADTVIEFAGRAVGKPADQEEAGRMLLQLSGRTHTVLTAVALLCRAAAIRCIFCVSTRVVFRAFGPETVAAYLARVHVLDKAGAYALQEHGDMLVAGIVGPADNVIGLPGAELREALQCCGLASLMANDAPSR
ncbi:MAG: Maf family protein [Victivallales bacterium]|nr:Maf family protein [Victivallales bacterium]